MVTKKVVKTKKKNKLRISLPCVHRGFPKLRRRKKKNAASST